MTTALLIALIMVISAGALNYRQRAREAAQAVLLHQERANHEEERVAILSEQVQKQRDAELRIAKALQVANQLERKALDDPNDPAKWAEAMAAARQARELLELFPGAGELHVRTADLLRKLETGSATALAREADQKMLAKLERVRLDKAEVRDDRFNYEQADVAYACAFREFGIDIGPLDVAESARRIRATTIPVELTAAIDDWATMRKLMGRGGFSFSARLFNVARLADPHPWRNRLRTAVEKDDGPELLELTRSAPTMDPLPSTWVILANGLESTGQPNAAVDLLVRAQSRFPTDFWINHELGMACMNLEPPDYDRAIRYFTVAVALRATSPGANVNLGFALVRKGKYADAIASFDKAIALQPTYAQAHANRGYALTQLGRFDEAINAVTKAIELQPKNAGSHYLLGKTLQENGDTKGAVEPLRQAVAMRPKSDLYQSQLAKALSDLGDHSGAAAAAREAAQLVPKAEYFTLLGNALAALGDRDGAADAYNVAVCLSPNSGVVYYNLANLYAKDKDFVRAVELFDEALRHRPDYAEALCNRGLALRYLGRFRESVDSLRRGHELGSRRPDWRYRSSAWLATAMRLAKLDESLQAHLRGEQLSRNALELIAFGDLTYEYRSQPHGALRFYHAAMAVQPDVLRSPDSFLRFKAARAAIAAATGNGQEPALPAPEQIELFKVAEMWLSELASEWVTAVAKGSMSSQDAVAALGSIRNDPVFAAIRNERDLAKLPIECQHTWRRGSANLDQALSRIREIPAKP
jgi:tetratricopeptide (TPR) repeat protein